MGPTRSYFVDLNSKPQKLNILSVKLIQKDMC
jgi:hypothetical protein